MALFDSATKNLLTPSEIVFLHGDQFARTAKLGKIRLVHTEMSVSTAELGRVIVLAAFLACEQVGEFLFEIREEKKLLGLRKVPALFAVPGGTSGTWPEGSLEAAFSASARQEASHGRNDVRTIVYEWLAADSGDPWRVAVEKLQAGMAGRGLLEAREEKKAKVFSVIRYSLPDSTAQLRNEHALESVRKLIADCREVRSEIFGLLEKQVNKAVRARTDQDS